VFFGRGETNQAAGLALRANKEFCQDSMRADDPSISADDHSRPSGKHSLSVDDPSAPANTDTYTML